MSNKPETLDSLTDSKISNNNDIRFLPSGGESYQIRWRLLDQAQHSIHIATFSMMNDETTKRLENVLVAKLEEGVVVRIILDEIVNRTTFAGPMIKRLKAAGAHIHGYNDLLDEWLPFPKSIGPFKHITRNLKLKLKRHYHEKYMIVDGKEVILGGINWGDKYAYGGIKSFAWRDTDVYLQGPVVRDIQTQFLKDFTRYKSWENRQSNQATFYTDFVKAQPVKSDQQIQDEYTEYFREGTKLGDVDVRYVAHKPYDDNNLPLTHAFLSLIKNAEHSIYWGCHGIRPPKIIAQYLADAVQRGVEVHLVTNSQYSSQSLMVKGLLGWMYKECTKHYRGLLESGVKIWEWQLEGAFHSKNFLVDDQISSIGSYNMARGSTYHHSESNIFVYDEKFAAEVKQQFEKDFEHCKPIWLDDIDKRLPSEDAYSRPLHERDLMINRDMIPANIQHELDKGDYIRILT
jgi:phosphatidylserine/phosphatidylglycerophosphate/cardiolipin synthase-like enzyme